MTLNSIWHLLISSTSIANLIGLAAVAVAVLLPKQLDFVTDLRKWAIVVAVVAFGYSTIYMQGYSNGIHVKQSEWDASVRRATDAGEAARNRAERDVGGNAGGLSDKWNRDDR